MLRKIIRTAQTSCVYVQRTRSGFFPVVLIFFARPFHVITTSSFFFLAHNGRIILILLYHNHIITCVLYTSWNTRSGHFCVLFFTSQTPESSLLFAQTTLLHHADAGAGSSSVINTNKFQIWHFDHDQRCVKYTHTHTNIYKIYVGIRTNLVRDWNRTNGIRRQLRRPEEWCSLLATIILYFIITLSGTH